MTPIRLVVGNMPEMLLQIVAQAIRGQPDLLLAHEARGNVELLQVARDSIDLVVLGAEAVSPCPGVCSHLLSELPHLKIVVVSNSGARARSYWLGLRQRQASAASTDALLAELRRLYQIDAME